VPEPIPAGRQLYFIPVSYHREAFRPEIDVNERALNYSSEGLNRLPVEPFKSSTSSHLTIYQSTKAKVQNGLQVDSHKTRATSLQVHKSYKYTILVLTTNRQQDSHKEKNRTCTSSQLMYTRKQNRGDNEALNN